MKKLLVVILAIVGTTAATYAQPGKKANISLGVDAGIPTGLASTGFSFVIGGSVQADFSVSKNFDLSLSGGYQSWLFKGGGGSNSYIPFLGGFKYDFSPKVYGSGQIGVSVAASKNAGTPFTYVPGIGFRVSRSLDLLIKYTGMAFKGGVSYNDVGVRLAYNFGK